MSTQSSVISTTAIPPEELAKDSLTIFGFWTYLMTDLVLFAGLFAVYAVFRANTFGGPGGSAIFSGRFIVIETLILLTSSFICGLAMLAARDGRKNRVLFLLLVTAILGVAFLTMELTEFHHLALLDDSWQRSGFLSAYFTLVGTHGLHIAVGLLWAVALMISIARIGFTRSNMRKLVLFSMFWHFLDIVWIFIFTIVYLLSLT